MVEVNKGGKVTEGEVIELVPLDEELAKGGDYLDEEERARLHATIEAAEAELDAG